MMIPVLVSGSTGPIGKAVMKGLALQGVAALGVSRSTQPSFDVYDLDSVNQVLSTFNPESVVFLSNPSPSDLENNRELINSFPAIVEEVAELAERNGVKRFIFASSAAVYGTLQSMESLSEYAPQNGMSDYARLKINSELRLNRLRDKGSRLEIISLRIFNVYGPGCSESLINKIKSENATVWETHNWVRDYIHVEDVAEAIVRALEAPYPISPFLNVGTGIGTSNMDLLALATTNNLVQVDQPQEFSVSIADTHLATSVLNFTARNRLIEFMSGP